MKIQHKLPIIFCLILSIVGIGGISSFHHSDQHLEKFSNLINQNIPLVNNVYLMEIHLNKLLFEVEEYFALHSSIQILDEQYNAFNFAFKNYETSILENFPERQTLLDEVSTKKNDIDQTYFALRATLISHENNFEPYDPSIRSFSDDAKLLHQQLEIDIEKLSYILDGIIEFEYAELKKDESSLIQSLSIFSWYSIILLSLGALGALFGSLILHNDIVTPLQKMRKIAQHISKGNYNQKINYDSNDEIGTLSNAFNIMVESLRQTRQINDDIKLELREQLKNLKNYKTAVDSSGVVAITDKHGTIEYVNPEFEKISKYPKEELIGKNHRILKSGFHPKKFYTEMWETILNGKVWKGNIKNRAKDGSYYWVSTTITPLLGIDGKPEHFISIRTDITQEKTIEEELEKTMLELKHADVLKNEFASMVTHELKTPLTPIRGYIDMLKEKNVLGELNSEQWDAICEIENNSERLERLVSDILDAQKLDMKKMSYEKKTFNIQAFLTRITKNISCMLDKNIVFENTNSLCFDLISDEQRIQQVIENLIRNSADFIKHDHGHIELGSSVNNSEIVFYVKDNGVGISTENQKHLFKKFYQADTSLGRKHGGTGLGLVICKGIVEGLGGEIWIESEEGKGTTVFFTIPLNQRPIEISSSK